MRFVSSILLFRDIFFLLIFCMQVKPSSSNAKPLVGSAADAAIAAALKKDMEDIENIKV